MKATSHQVIVYAAGFGFLLSYASALMASLFRICPQCRRRTDASECPDDGFPTVTAQRYETHADPLIGSVYHGRYRIEGLLGRGGMGAVYRATQLAMKRTVALKVLKPQLAEDLNQVKRFQQEAIASSRLEHPNTIRIVDHGQSEQGDLFIAMEFLEGETLQSLLKREGALGEEQTVRIARQILKSLAEAHSKGIFHRDLKPENVFLKRVHGERDFVKVLDFGIAKLAEPDTGMEHLTRTGSVIGTPSYMSPEQVRGEVVDGRSDLYSLGVVMYQLLAGHRPFRQPTPMAILYDHLNTVPPPLSGASVGTTSPDLAQLVMEALAKKCDDRPPSAEAFLDRLEGLAVPSARGRQVDPGQDTQAIEQTIPSGPPPMTQTL